MVPFVGLFVGVFCHPGCGAGIVGDDIDGNGQFLDVGRDGRCRAALDRGRLIHLVHGVVQILRGVEDRLSTGRRFPHRTPQGSLHFAHGPEQFSDFVARGWRQGDCQVAVGDFMGDIDGIVEPR